MDKLQHIKKVTTIGFNPESQYGKGYRDAMSTIRQLIEMIETVQECADNDINKISREYYAAAKDRYDAKP